MYFFVVLRRGCSAADLREICQLTQGWAEPGAAGTSDRAARIAISRTPAGRFAPSNRGPRLLPAVRLPPPHLRVTAPHGPHEFLSITRRGRDQRSAKAVWSNGGSCRDSGATRQRPHLQPPGEVSDRGRVSTFADPVTESSGRRPDPQCLTRSQRSVPVH